MLALSRGKIKKQSKKGIAVALVAVLITTGLLFGFKEKIKEVEVVKRTISTIEFIKEGNVPDRVSWILSSIEMIKDRPLFGFGVSAYQDVYNQYRRLDYRVPGEEQDRIVPHSAHNEYLNIAATQGLLALAIYVMLFGFVIFRAYKVAINLSKQKDEVPKDAFMLICLATSLLAYLFQVLINFGVVGTMVPFFILLGITHGYTLNLEEESSEINLKGYAGGGLILILLAFTSLNVYINDRMIRADIFLKISDGLNTHPDFEEKGYIYHIDAMERAIGYNPYEYRLYEKRGEFYLRQGVEIAKLSQTEELLEHSVRSYEEALKLNNLHANTYKDLATTYKYLADVYAQVGNKAKMSHTRKAASDAYNEAVRLSPNNPLYRDLAAKTYIEFGETYSALELYKEIQQMRPEYPKIDSIIMDLSEDLQVY